MNNISENKSTLYNWGLDLIRVIAMFLVILVHSTTFYGFGDVRITSVLLFFVGMGRYLAYACVPLFMMLTGYLSLHKEPSSKYYFKLLKILFEYILCGAFVFLFNRFILNDLSSLKDTLSQMQSYQFPKYSWYINMFVGLYLLAPFLNYGYKGIPDKHKFLFIMTLILIFSITKFTTYWIVAYPIMYYFIGCYIKDKQPQIKKAYLIIPLLTAIIINTIYRCESHTNIGCVIITTCIFLLFYNLKTGNTTKLKSYSSKTLRVIANASLSTFLISVVFETMTENFFNKYALIEFSQRLPHLLYLTPLKFLLSIIGAIIINYVATQLFNLIRKSINKHGKIEI